MCNNIRPDAAAEAIITANARAGLIFLLSQTWRISTPPVKQNMPGLSFLIRWRLCNLVRIWR